MGYKYWNGYCWVSGNAALLHTIKEDGGLNNHYNKIISHAIKHAIDDYIENANNCNTRKNFKNVK